MAKRVWIGLIFIVLGVGFLLQLAGIIDFTSLLQDWWPLIFVVIGVIILLNRTYSSTVSGWLFILVGALLIFNQWTDMNLASFILPAILIFIGLVFIFSKQDKKDIHVDDDINSFTLFSGAEVRSQSKNFQSGSVTAIFGGADIDLRDAVIADEGATIEVTTIFGGLELIVPENVIVEISGIPIFGGWEDNTKRFADDADLPIIKLNCLTIFGGVEVRN